MKVINFAEQQTVVNRYMSELRDVCIQKDRARFRRNLERIGEVMAYEISKTLDYSVKDIQTPLGTAPTLLYNDPIVLGTIFRAGLPFHQGFLNVFEEADNAFVSAYRFYKDKECHEVGIHIEYLATPDLNGKTLIIADPMLATGGSLIATIDILKKRGCKHICSLNLVCAPEGIAKVQEKHPDVEIYTASVDSHLNENGYIIPGLGDAGDRIFGTK